MNKEIFKKILDLAQRELDVGSEFSEKMSEVFPNAFSANLFPPCYMSINIHEIFPKEYKDLIEEYLYYQSDLTIDRLYDIIFGEKEL